MPKDFGIGASSKRREDVRFLTGKGVYTDDLRLYGQTYAVFVRSQVAHGKIVSISTAAAAEMPGVLAIFTGEDFKDVGGKIAQLGSRIIDGFAKKMADQFFERFQTAVEGPGVVAPEPVVTNQGWVNRLLRALRSIFGQDQQGGAK